CGVASAHFRLQTLLTHQAFYLLVVDDHSSMLQLGANPPPAVAFKLVADHANGFDDCCVVGERWRGVVVGRAGDSHQPASFADAQTRGPTMTDVFALFGGGALLRAPFRNSNSNACLPTSRSRAAIRASYR